MFIVQKYSWLLIVNECENEYDVQQLFVQLIVQYEKLFSLYIVLLFNLINRVSCALLGYNW